MKDSFVYIFFAGRDFIDIEEENEGELNKTWEWLREICLGREVSKNGKQKYNRKGRR